MKKLLFVDDDRDFLQGNQLYFSRKGYEVFCTAYPEKALELFTSIKFDCIILDIDMPDVTGFDLCQKLREYSGTPVIFLSGLCDAPNRIASFRAGGDDFLAKPYDIVELELRISARIRKPEQVFFSDKLRYGDLMIDPNQSLVTYQETIGDFTALQFDILYFLASNPGKLFSYEQLYDQIWKVPLVKSRHNLQVTVATIRQKLTQLCQGNSYIHTVSRKGYYFEAPETS